MNETNACEWFMMICVMFTILICVIGMGLYYGTSQVETKISRICDIGDHHIVLCSGEVIFAKDINQFEWELGEVHDITLESHFDILGNTRIRIIENTKYEIGDENGPIRKLGI